MQEQQLKRRYPNRLVRSRTPREMELEQHHLAILRLLTKYRYLTASEIVQLLPPQVQRIYPNTLRRQGVRAAKPETLAMWEAATEKPGKNGTMYWELKKPPNLRSVKNWLQDMFENGYVTRRPRRRGEWLHSLSNEGALVLQDLGELENTRADWDRYNREPETEHAEHTRMISRVRAALNLALPNPNKEASFDDDENWRPESKELRLEVTLEERERPMLIRPDAFFRIKVPRGYYNYFLEAVRNNPERRRFLLKLQAYWYGRADYYEKLDIKRYRVLILTTSEVRRDHILRMIQKELNDGEGSGLFFLGAEYNPNPHARVKEPDRCFNINSPESLLAPIWKCGQAQCQKWHCLVE